MKGKISQKINVHIHAKRNLIDVEDIKQLTLKQLKESRINQIVNIAYPENFSIIEILEILEEFYDIKLGLKLISEGSGYDITVRQVEKYFKENNLTDKKDYLIRILNSYYKH